MEETSSVPVLRIDEKLERDQCERVRRVRARRDEQAAVSSLDQVERAARSGENLMPEIIRAVEAYSTLGEISDRLRAVFGEYKGEI
jgi:methylmalonyl-CoA mutase N-terminal domain/subunit